MKLITFTFLLFSPFALLAQEKTDIYQYDQDKNLLNDEQAQLNKKNEHKIWNDINENRKKDPSIEEPKKIFTPTGDLEIDDPKIPLNKRKLKLDDEKVKLQNNKVNVEKKDPKIEDEKITLPPALINKDNRKPIPEEKRKEIQLERKKVQVNGPLEPKWNNDKVKIRKEKLFDDRGNLEIENPKIPVIRDTKEVNSTGEALFIGNGKQDPLLLDSNMTYPYQDLYTTEYSEMLKHMDLEYLSPWNDKYPLKKWIIFEDFVGAGPNQAQAYHSDISARFENFSIGMAVETASWLYKKTNTGKYTETVYLDSCLLAGFDTEYFSIEPCFRGGIGNGIFVDRDARNEIEQKELKRTVTRPYVRFQAVAPFLRNITVQGVYGFSNDDFIYGQYVQAYIMTPWHIALGWEKHGDQRTIFSIGTTLGFFEHSTPEVKKYKKRLDPYPNSDHSNDPVFKPSPIEPKN